MRYLVYLSGPISGLTYDDADNWRNLAKLTLERNSRIECLDPLRCKEFLRLEGEISPNDNYGNYIASDEFIGTRDHWDTTRCDLMLVNLLGAKTVSIGTVLEIGMAYATGVKIFVVMGRTGNVHEHCMIRNYTTMRFSEMESACAAIKAMFSV